MVIAIAKEIGTKAVEFCLKGLMPYAQSLGFNQSSNELLEMMMIHVLGFNGHWDAWNVVHAFINYMSDELALRPQNHGAVDAQNHGAAEAADCGDDDEPALRPQNHGAADMADHGDDVADEPTPISTLRPNDEFRCGASEDQLVGQSTIVSDEILS